MPARSPHPLPRLATADPADAKPVRAKRALIQTPLGRWAIVAATSCLLTAALSTSSAVAQHAVTLACKLEPGPNRSVSAIIDGETVLLDDGKEVRLVGALAPRSSDAARGKHAAALDWPPEAAARAALAELVAGRSVALAFAGRRVDRYGRLLAQVFLKGNTGDVWVQGRMIALGHARAYALPETDSCLTDLLKLEAPARRERRGLWGHAAYQIRPADRPRELARYAATFQLMRGVVERAGRSRRGTYLELASSEPPRPGDAARNKGLFRVILPHEAKAGRRPAKTDDLVSRSVLVRGWVETRSGPQVALSERAELEIDE